MTGTEPDGDRSGDGGLTAPGVAMSGGQPLELLVLGAGPAYSDRPGSAGASYLVRCGGTTLVLDLGQGSFPNLAQALDPSELAAVVVSHLHPDHFIDLIPLRHYLCRAEFQPSRRLRVIAPRGLDVQLDGAYAQPGFTAAALDVEDPSDGPWTLGSFVLSSGRVTHHGESRAWRVAPAAGGPGLVYTGDASDPDELAPLLHPGDTLLAEATFGPGPVPRGMLHLDGPTVGTLAASAGAGSVVITHVRMGMDPDATAASVSERFAGPVTIARPGLRMRLSGGPAPGAPALVRPV